MKRINPSLSYNTLLSRSLQLLSFANWRIVEFLQVRESKSFKGLRGGGLDWAVKRVLIIFNEIT
jgi:hypothetical protein